MEAFGQYFSLMVLPHKVFGFSTNLHRYLAANSLQNRYEFLIPHPPLDFGRTIFVHLTKGIPSIFALLFHKKEKHFFLIFAKRPFGIYEMDAQYTRMLCKTNFNNTNLPPLDKNRFFHMLFCSRSFCRPTSSLVWSKHLVLNENLGI